MRRNLCLAAVLVQCVLLASGAADAQSTANPVSAALAGAPKARADRNQMRDHRTADPGERITLIDAPGVNNEGDASVSYPLDLPSGRLGVNPRLALHYTSGGSNGWLGVGWDLSVPSVSIDTRWGVPRYDPGLETETYMVAGAELTPLAHRGALQARAADKTFQPRIEGAFERIIRYGNHPSNYRWEVTDQRGVRYFYGDAPGGPSGTHTLRDDSGNIFRWALRLVQDLSGNTTSYDYSMVVDPGVSGGSVPGYQLYPKTIHYTGSGAVQGPYSVTFVRDREIAWPRRPDVAIDARGGFKMVTADLLKLIEVRFNQTLIRRYDLDYVNGAYGESLLSKITQRGEDLSSFYEHTFDYYREPLGFGSASTWSTGIDSVNVAELPIDGVATALGGSVSGSVGAHLYLGFNPTNPDKKGSFGGKIGFNFSQNEGVLELIDINGDGLPDKVYRTLLGVFVRYNQSGPDGGTSFGPVIALPSLPGISTERTITVSAGAEAYPFAANVGINFSESFSLGSTYFADVNNDGLIDLVAGGDVLFNHYNGSGAPSFNPDSTSTGVPVAPGSVDAVGVIPDFEDSYQRQIDMFPLADSIRRWVAPYNGVIDISGSAALLQSADPERATYTTADGVRFTIQKNGVELFADTIGETDYGPHLAALSGVPVAAGDRIYFRVQSIFDGSYDDLAWDPVITYAGAPPPLDVNGLDPSRYQASSDFTYTGRPHSQARAQYNGVVHVTGDLHKLAATTDDVTVVLTKNGQVALQRSLSAAQIGDILLDDDINVAKDDMLELRVAIDSPINLAAIQWAPRAYYISTPDVDNQNNPIAVFDDQSAPLIDLNIIYDADTYPMSALTAPQASWVAPSTTSVTVTPQIAGMAGASGPIVFTVKKRGALLAKQAITMTSGVANAAPIAVDVTQDDEIFFDFSITDPALAAKIVSSSVTAGIVAVPSAVHSAGTPDLFPVPYRGWAVAGYNGNRDFADLPIDEARLVLASQAVENNCAPDQITSQDDFTSSGCNPSGATAWSYSPFPAEGVWRGNAKLAVAAASQFSASRAGPPYISVPRPEQFLGASAVLRISHNTQIAVSGGIGPLSISATPFGLSEGDVDFLDLNGDGFPDVVGNGNVQYTLPTGGLESSSHPVPGMDGLRTSLNFAEGIGLAGNVASSTANAKGRVASSNKGGPKGNKSGNQMSQLGLSGDLGLGQSNQTSELMDVNGDGLPDRVYRAIGGQLRVALNLGYGFAAEEVWGDAAINEGASGNFGLGISPSFNDGVYGFAGGLSISSDVSQAGCKFVDPVPGYCLSSGWMLTDVNGDGLPDRVSPGVNTIRVALNMGQGFGPEQTWDSPLGGAVSKTRQVSAGGGVYFTIPVGPLCIGACYMIINPGVDIGVSLSRQEASIIDVDGDGYPDHVTSNHEGELTVAKNLRGRSGLLKSIQRPLGARIDIEYERDGNTFAHAASRWTLSKVTVNDGHPGDGVDDRVTTYRYSGGRYDRLERQFYGYAQVIAEDRDASNNDALYRVTVHDYRNDSFYSHGLLVGERTLDALGRTFVETLHTYDFRDVSTSGPGDLASTTDTIFPMKVRTEQRFYEGLPAPQKSASITFAYDAFGRLTNSTDSGDVGLDDDVVKVTDYADCLGTHVLALPIESVTRDGHGTLMRRSESAVDCALGLVTQTREYADNVSAAVTDFTFYPNGNIHQIKGPVSASLQRTLVAYTYDAPTATHVTSVVDSFGLVTTSTHDLKYGVLLSTTDENANVTSYTYDVFGRVTSMRLPYEQSGGPPTLTFEYHPGDSPAWAITKRRDSARSATDTIDSVVFVDGELRVIQAKHDATIFAAANAPAADVMIVSGKKVLDFMGRVVEERYPLIEPLGSAGVWSAASDAVAPTTITYDVLDRPLSEVQPDGATQHFSYGFGQDNHANTRLRVSTQDPNGVFIHSYRDVRGLTIAQQHLNNGGQETIWTSFGYNAMRELTEMTDDQGNTTMVAYDLVGRRTAINSPDAGYSLFQYDLAGNLIRRVTPNLGPLGQAIDYHYDFDRMTDVIYPRFPENNIHYTYGPPGAPGNGAGEITRVDDSSGSEQRTYGKLGEVTKTVRTIVEKPSRGGGLLGTYTTQYTYDSYGRLQSLTYPDGEVVTYAYDSGGFPRALSGQKGLNAYTYVSRFEYDKFFSPSFVRTGNGVETSYTFDPVSRDLLQIQARKAASLFQDLLYTYDDVGNVLSLANNVPLPPPSQYGGPSAQTFTYDDLRRLKSASGTYRVSSKKDQKYSLSLAYDTIHNITQKQQSDAIYNTPNNPIPQQGTTYSLSYAYGSTRPHAATMVDNRTFHYDAAGNQTGWDHNSSGQKRTIVWNEDDRIESISDNGSLTLLQYNDAGDRVLRRGPNGRTIYANEYFTDEPGGNAVKHFFVGSVRVASKLVKSTLESVQLFLHTDRAGNTTYVTDAAGAVFEHLEYFPFGEVWIEDSSSTTNTPYLFAGKELDEGTGLSYFGARYYDARTSLWQSPDPALDDYINGAHGGLLNPLNASLYGYGWQNPLRFTDSDGMVPGETRLAYRLHQHFRVYEGEHPLRSHVYEREGLKGSTVKPSDDAHHAQGSEASPDLAISTGKVALSQRRKKKESDTGFFTEENALFKLRIPKHLIRKNKKNTNDDENESLVPNFIHEDWIEGVQLYDQPGKWLTFAEYKGWLAKREAAKAKRDAKWTSLSAPRNPKPPVGKAAQRAREKAEEAKANKPNKGANPSNKSRSGE